MSNVDIKKLVSHFSHELRNPLASSQLFLDMLLNGMTGELNEQQKEMLTEIQKSHAKMLELIEAFKAEVNS